MSEKIFISYSRDDSSVVYPLKDEIEQHLGSGTCWIDYNGIESDQQFVDVIIGAIKRADIFLFMHSVHSQQSKWTKKEIHFADKQKKRIVIVSVDNTEFDDWFEFQYGLYQRSFLSNPQSRAKLLSDLKSWISSEPNDHDSYSQSPSYPAFKDETITVNGVSFKMIAVQGGTFSMGSKNGDSDEKPVHEVTLSSYHIGETEVTQELWNSVMGYINGLQNPKEMASWTDCQEFISKLNSLTGKQFRLPTEAEWEYAARGGNKSRGYKYSGSDDIDMVAWYQDNSASKTHPVKTKSPNELGIYDMSGNVWEWCYDRHGTYSSSSVRNPTGPSVGEYRVIRGGSSGSDASDCRVPNRSWNGPTLQCYRVGLRLAF